jgi:hypothetical protein
VNRLRAILRPNRPELRAALILGFLMVAAGAGAILWLQSFKIPDECFEGPQLGGGDLAALCLPYQAAMFAYGEAFGTVGNPAAISTLVAPIVVALVMGIAALAREIEQQTTNFAWSIAPSRARWLRDRMIPILVVVLALGLAGGSLGDILMGLRQRGVDPWRNFEGLGLRGPTIAASGLLVFGFAGLVGAAVGRQLPALLISGAVIGFGVYGAFTVSDAWVQGDAVVGTYDQTATGDKILDSLIRTPEGEYISWDEAYQRFGSKLDTISYDGTDNGSGLRVATRYVPGERYPAAVARLSGLLGGGGLAAIALTFFVVHRRRPY